MIKHYCHVRAGHNVANKWYRISICDAILTVLRHKILCHTDCHRLWYNNFQVFQPLSRQTHTLCLLNAYGHRTPTARDSALHSHAHKLITHARSNAAVKTGPRQPAAMRGVVDGKERGGKETDRWRHTGSSNRWLQWWQRFKQIGSQSLQ